MREIEEEKRGGEGGGEKDIKKLDFRPCKFRI